MAHCPRYLQAVAACQLTPRPAHPLEMTTKSRQRIYGASIRASAQRAKEARKEADRLACEAWNMRLPGFTGPAQMRSYSACYIQDGTQRVEVAGEPSIDRHLLQPFD
jgi:hypothetical protein